MKKTHMILAGVLAGGLVLSTTSAEASASTGNSNSTSEAETTLNWKSLKNESNNKDWVNLDKYIYNISLSLSNEEDAELIELAKAKALELTKNTAKQDKTVEPAKNTAKQNKAAEPAKNTDKQDKSAEPAKNAAKQNITAEPAKNTAKQNKSAEQAKNTAKQENAVEQPKKQTTQATDSKPVTQEPKKETNQATTQSNTSNNPSTATKAPSTTNNSAQASVSSEIQQVVDLTNKERAKQGLAALQIDTNLTKSAQAKSKDMKDNNYFSHTSPTYGSPFDQMKSFGVTYKTAGENIAMGQRTPAEVVEAWMNSEGHRANIMNANFTHIGVGLSDSGFYWTQQFIGK